MENKYEMVAELLVNIMYVLLGAFELFVLPYHDMVGKALCLGFATFFVLNRSWIKNNIRQLIEALF